MSEIALLSMHKVSPARSCGSSGDWNAPPARRASRRSARQRRARNSRSILSGRNYDSSAERSAVYSVEPPVRQDVDADPQCLN